MCRAPRVLLVPRALKAPPACKAPRGPLAPPVRLVRPVPRASRALKTHGGNDELHRDSCHALYKSPGTTGWCSIAVFPRTSKQFYGQVVLHGYSGNSFGGLPSAIGASIYANGHQLRSGIALGHYEFTLQNQGLFDTLPPLIQLPAPLFIGSTSIRGASTHFGKVTRPDGVMLQLGQRSRDRMCGCGFQPAPATCRPAPGARLHP